MLLMIGFLSLAVLGAELQYPDDEASSEITQHTTQKSPLKKQSEQVFLNKFNPFLSIPTLVPQLSKEYQRFIDKRGSGGARRQEA